MNYKIINLTKCHSTQDELKNQMKGKETFEALAIATNEQIKGKGRRERSWKCFEKSLAVSFTYRPEKVITLTALRVGVIICRYFNQVHNKKLNLKWPNDILNSDGHKVGGVIIDIHSNDVVLVGLGLNLYYDEKMQNVSFDYPIGHILNLDEEFHLSDFFDTLNSVDKFDIGDWVELCCHLDKKVTFESNGEFFEDIFIGIGKNGEALFDKASPQYSGSIRL